jgi:ABC-2 type transport system permease protein
MKGLWVKDLLILRKQKLAAVLTLILAILSLAFFSQNGIMIGMAIFSVTLSFLILNSLTLDQQNHGLMYLLTLPFKKKQYVIQKYLLLLFTLGCSVILMTAISVIFAELTNWNLHFSDVFVRVYGVGLAILLVLIVTTQYQIKHGPEKAQVAMSLIGAIVAVVVGGMIALVKYTEFGDNAFKQVSAYYMDYGSIPFLVIFTLVGAVIISASCIKSIKTLETMDIQ